MDKGTSAARMSRRIACALVALCMLMPLFALPAQAAAAEGMIGSVSDSVTEVEQFMANGTGTHVVTASALNVRTGPGTSYSVCGRLYRGDRVNVVSLSGSYCRIQAASGDYGYVARQYLDAAAVDAALEEGTTVEIVTDVYEKIPPAETKVILDTAGEFVTYTDETKVKKKARDGIKVKSYRVVKVNGEEVSRELLRDDYYKEVQGEVYQGVTPREGANIPAEDAGGNTEGA